MEVIWKDVPEFTGYRVSSGKRIEGPKGQIDGTITAEGKVLITMYRDGVRHGVLLDKLFAMLFEYEDLPAEEWRFVVGCDDYEVSSCGRVRAEWNTVLKQTTSRKGYLVIQLRVDGEIWTVPVHKLVAAAFIGECQDGRQVNHKDGNKRNNTPGNLEYVSGSENMLHRFRVLGQPGALRKVIDIKGIEADLDAGMPIRAIVRKWHVNSGTVSRIKHGTHWQQKVRASLPD
jgi:hypothetical protein